MYIACLWCGIKAGRSGFYSTIKYILKQSTLFWIVPNYNAEENTAVITVPVLCL